AERAELLAVVGDAAAGAAQGEARPQYAGQPDALADLVRLGKRAGHSTLRHFDADGEHRLLELLAVLGPVDDLGAGPDQLDAEPLQDAPAVQLHGAVEGGLPADGGQEG